MWTATQGGLYFSDDMAETWQLNPVVSQRDAVISLHFFEEKLFIVAVINEQDLDPIITKKQLYVSSDNGLNWTMNHEFHERTYHLNLTKITHIVDKLCYENEYKNLYKSDDYGQTWDSIIAPGFHSKFNYHHQGIIAKNSEKEMHLSLDCGTTWKVIPNNNPVIQNIHDFQGNHILAGGYDQTTQTYPIYLSTDLGQNWTEINAPVKNTNIGFLYQFWGEQHDTIWAQADSLYFSADWGQHWKIWDQWGSRMIVPYLCTPAGGFVHYTTSGIEMINYDTRSWTVKNKGMVGQTVSSLHASGAYLIAKGATHVYTSTDQGENWIQMIGLSAPEVIESGFFVKGDTIYQQTYQSILFAPQFGAHGWDTLCSIDFGLNATISLKDNYFQCSYQNGKLLAIIDAQTGIITQINPPPNTTNQFKSYLQKIGNRLIFATPEGYVYTSDNMGQQWLKAQSEFLYYNYTDNRLYQLQSGLYLCRETGILRSTDQGSTWDFLYSVGLPKGNQEGYKTVTSLVQEGNTLFATFPFSGVYFSVDFGNNWQAFNEGLESTRGRCLAVQDGQLFVGTSTCGVWRRGTKLNRYAGKVYLDYNQNLKFDAGDSPLNQSMVQISHAGYFTNTSSDGSFELFGQIDGTDTLTLRPFSSFATAIPDFYEIGSMDSTGLDFAIHLTPNLRDLSIDLTNLDPYNRGYQTTLIITVKNNGTVPLKPSVSLSKTPYLIYSFSYPYANIYADSVLWELPELSPFDSTLITIFATVDVNAILDSNVVLIAQVQPVQTDLTPENNTSILNDHIVASYDPNDKQVYPSSALTPAAIVDGQVLTYTIRFQNMGNYPTSSVRILDTLDKNLDVATLQIISASHPFTWRLLAQNILEFNFDPIHLTPAEFGNTGSQGFVKYAVMAKKTLMLGDNIYNRAHIFFDYNAAIVTNLCKNTVHSPELTHTPENIKPLSIVPNPANQSVTLRWETAQGGTLELLDAAGKKVLQQKIALGANSTLVTIDTLPEGLYFIRFSGNTEHLFGKLIITH
ncbi:MAG: DUF7619 domain-containing protein [Saprospiraceae bacterium]